MNQILITNAKRRDLLFQTMSSLYENAAEKSSHHLTVVVDGYESYEDRGLVSEIKDHGAHEIHLVCRRYGACYARNAGAGSIPKARRHKSLMFIDDDCFFAKNYDSRLETTADALPRMIYSPYGHPYNIEEAREEIIFARFPLVISSVAMFLPWSAFDEIGDWAGDGGTGGSEDFEFCSRARILGYDFAVLNPYACIHTGLISSNGNPIVGAELLRERNAGIERLYDIEGKVIYG